MLKWVVELKPKRGISHFPEMKKDFIEVNSN